MIYRNPDLLHAVRTLTCTLQIPGVCLGASAPTVACHSNQARHGKGKSMKASDVFVAAGCAACHREIDQGAKLSREDRFHYWQRGHEQTIHLLFMSEVLIVAPEWRRPEHDDVHLQQSALARQLPVPSRPTRPRGKPSRKTGHQNGRSTTRSSKTIPRGQRGVDLKE